ncbi:MAG: spore coat protein CotJB [Clostridia bacterium]|nr:spore coat protein CotJB [Clostridia bacterium]
MPCVRTREEMLERIQALEFTAVDLNLYLDTHPCDSRALADYNQVCVALRQTCDAYEHAFGPMMNFGNSIARCRWSWVDEPWPWQSQS